MHLSNYRPFMGLWSGVSIYDFLWISSLIMQLCEAFMWFPREYGPINWNINCSIFEAEGVQICEKTKWYQNSVSSSIISLKWTVASAIQSVEPTVSSILPIFILSTTPLIKFLRKFARFSEKQFLTQLSSLVSIVN